VRVRKRGRAQGKSGNSGTTLCVDLADGWVRVCVRVCMRVFAYMRVSLCMHLCVYVCIHACVRVYMCGVGGIRLHTHAWDLAVDCGSAPENRSFC
jgi:hypothetical protein